MTVPFGKRELAIVAGILVLAFAVRVAFFSNQGYAAVDTLDFKLWFQRAADIGPRAFYSNDYWCDYPPLNIYFFWVFGLVAKSLGVFGSPLFTYIMKLPPNLIDMATAFLIFFFVRKRLSFNWSMVATALYAFNPAVIFDAAVWGQFDAIYTFFLVSSLFLVFSSKPKLAVVIYMLGVLTKPQSIALAPLFFYLIWQKTDWKGILASVLVAAGTIFAVILPFEWSNPVTFLSNLYFGAYNGYQFTTLNAFNIWAFGGMWVPDTTATFILGWTLFAALAAFALYFVHRNSEKNYELAVLLAAFVLFFGFFMFPTRIHERYLFPAMAILALMFPFLKRTRPLYVVLTTTCFVNQAYVLSFLNAGTFIQLGDLMVLIVSLLNSAALLYVLILMVKDLPQRTRKTSTPAKIIRVQEQLEEHPPATDEPKNARKVSFPKLGRRDLLTILALCIVFFSIATYNLGLTQSPVNETALYAGQSFYLDLGNQSATGSVHFLIHDGSYNVSVFTGSPGKWQSVSTNRSFSDYYKWNEVSIDRTTQFIRVDLLSSNDEAAFEEIAVSDSNHQQIRIANVTGLDSAGTSLQNLVDEQDKIQMPFTYMTQTYFDEIYFVRTAEQYLNLQSPYEWTHPPLGKLIQAASIVVFGFNPFGWRIIGVLFATFMIPVIYILGKKLFGTWIGAFAASFLLTFDFMHFTMGRMGTADTYVVFFALLSQLFFFIYFTEAVKKGWKTPILPLFLAVIFFMLGFSTKWLVLYGALGMLALLIFLRFRELRKMKAGLGQRYAAFFDYPFMLLLGFIVVSIGVYFLLYIPDMLTGRPFFGTNGVIDLQFHMYGYHANLVATHPFASAWWSWPFMVSPTGYVPIWLAVSYLPNGVNSTISAFGNPAIWWVGFVAVIVLTGRIIQGRGLWDVLNLKIRTALILSLRFLQALWKKTVSKIGPLRNPPILSSVFSLMQQFFARGPRIVAVIRQRWDLTAVFIVTLFFFSWIPYVFISRVTFIYHYYVSVPFLCLASAYFVNKAWRTRRGKAATIVFFIVVVALFILFYPVISGVPVSTDWIHKLKWFPSWYFAP